MGVCKQSSEAGWLPRKSGCWNVPVAVTAAEPSVPGYCEVPSLYFCLFLQLV